MLYYQVKPEYDNYNRYRWNNQHQGVHDGVLVGNELYTPREYSKLANYHGCFMKVEVSKRSVYWFFGARFAPAEVIRYV